MFAVSTSPVNARNGSYMVCSSIVEYTEQAGSRCLEKNDCAAI